MSTMIMCSRGKGGGCRVVTLPEPGNEALPKQESVTKTEVIDMEGPPEGAAEEATPGEDHPVNKLSSAVPEADAPRPPCEIGMPRSARSPNLVTIPAGTPPERCTGVKCRARKEGAATIYKVKHPTTGSLTPAAVALEITLPKDGAVVGTGAFAPYLDAAPGRATIERPGLGYSHFIDCPDSKAFKRK